MTSHYNPKGRKAVERGSFIFFLQAFHVAEICENRFHPAERSVNRPERMASQVERWTDFPGSATWSVTKNIFFFYYEAYSEERTEVQSLKKAFSQLFQELLSLLLLDFF